MENVNVVIIGAGVVGLSIAAELSHSHKDVIIIERNPSFGCETSSRNSEVIHAGIYYPKDSLKAKTCLEGSRLLYEFCKRNKIAHKRLGKLIVAVSEKDVVALEKLFNNGKDNGVRELTLLSGSDIRKLEPKVNAKSAIYSPSTGILDTHGFMKCLAASFVKSGGEIAYNSEVTGIERRGSEYNVTVTDANKESFSISSNIVINSGGLDSDRIAAFSGIDDPEYKLKYSKGDYFRIAHRNVPHVTHLVYPVPKSEGSCLGIHLTPDLSGGVRLGPDDQYVDKIDYNIDISKKGKFCESVRTFFPHINPDDIIPDTSGIRPKLQGKDEGFRDFIIRHEESRGLPGFISLIGIESPGLTASLSIAKMVGKMI